MCFTEDTVDSLTVPVSNAFLITLEIVCLDHRHSVMSLVCMRVNLFCCMIVTQ